jgi:hypothetical protein
LSGKRVGGGHGGGWEWGSQRRREGVIVVIRVVGEGIWQWWWSGMRECRVHSSCTCKGGGGRECRLVVVVKHNTKVMA